MFADLSDENLQALADIVEVRSFSKGSMIVGQGDAGTCMYLLTSGRVKVSLASSEGKELVLDYLEAPAHFGEMALVDSKSRSADVFAVTDVELLVLEGKDLSAAIQVQPRLALSIIATLSRRLRGTIGRLEDLAFHDATHRVMRVLLNVATAGLETRGMPVVQGMTHYDIATLAGTSRETASRVISQLTREGIIVPDGRRLTVNLSRMGERLEQQ
jgi:CRP-like cAMP-binding protein